MEKPKRYPNNFKKKTQKPTGAVRGNKIKVQNVKTKERIEMKITDSKNPFIGKELYDIVKIKGEDYKIVGIYFDSNK